MAAYLKNDPQRQVQLEQIGLEMEAAMQRLSTLTTNITCGDAASHGSYPTPIGGLFCRAP
ncbi:MAG: hypothetical protein DYG89_47440 [Caldilinea sp. CFX5]|nr:hypothetical protein [Caldilinea sp. CFX5]